MGFSAAPLAVLATLRELVVTDRAVWKHNQEDGALLDGVLRKGKIDAFAGKLARLSQRDSQRQKYTGVYQPQFAAADSKRHELADRHGRQCHCNGLALGSSLTH